MVKLPDSVQIGPYTLKVSRDRSHLRAGDLGCCRPSDGILVVADGLTPQETVMTYLHELAHMYTILYEGDVDETRAARMSAFLYELLRDNSGLERLVRRAEALTGGGK